MTAANPANLTDDLVIGTGGWHPAYARVILIVADEDVAFVLVDGNGDGSELEMEYWHKEADGWVGGQSSGYGALGGVSTVTWDAGPMVCAVGQCDPGDAVSAALWIGVVSPDSHEGSGTFGMNCPCA